MSATRFLLFGRGGGAAALLLANATWADDGEPFNGRARSDRIAIAGVGGEVALSALYLTVTYDADHTPLLVTPYLDDIAQAAHVYDLRSAGARQTTILEVNLSQALPAAVPNYATRGLWMPRCTWFQVEVATNFAGDAAYVDLDGIEIEYEIVNDGKHEGANP